MPQHAMLRCRVRPPMAALPGHRYFQDFGCMPIQRCNDLLQAAGAEVGKVTFMDADATSEMRQYVSHSHIDLHVEVCWFYKILSVMH